MASTTTLAGASTSKASLAEGQADAADQSQLTHKLQVTDFEVLLWFNPTTDFIHHRFCPIYPVHNWAHDPIIRIFLFHTFYVLQRLPTLDEVVSVFVLVQDLKQKMPEDIWVNVLPHIADHGMRKWMAFSYRRPRDRPWRMSTLSAFERSIMVLFADVIRKDWSPHWHQYPFPEFTTVKGFLSNPMLYTPDAEDILCLPGLPETKVLNELPGIAPSTCSCGRCEFIHGSLRKSPYEFRNRYSSIVSRAQRRACNGLLVAWEDSLQAAETWLEKEVARLESPADIFPFRGGDERLGPVIYDTANQLKLIIGSNFDTPSLLRFVSLLRLRCVPLEIRIESWALEMLQDIPVDGVGYALFVTRSISEFPGYMHEHEIVTSGNWLPQLASNSFSNPRATILHIPVSDDLILLYPELKSEDAIRPFVMPEHPASDEPDTLPRRHDDQDSITFEDVEDEEDADEEPESVELSIELSEESIDGYPLFSIIGDPYDDTYPALSLAARLSITIPSTDQVISTWWRPSIFSGTACEHSDLHSKAIRCSLSSFDILRQYQEYSSSYKDRLEDIRSDPFIDSEDWMREYRTALSEGLNERAECLTLPDGPFARRKAVIVRCSAGESTLPLVILAATCGRKVYMIHAKECWNCAVLKMHHLGCGLGIAIGVRQVETCQDCRRAAERAAALDVFV
ncbi:hypothetical protein SISSUDRAFT_1033663 [Sistotremastrum suecicum HHB10207 ss-3]|uniref:Uncharacterized protein n=1 Tax=Sistotremastrum suecicum HHB10207 ss-3 TaxID=1314776 RepID=A0A166D3P5_9AGAM|nr:hypothetical protein SISSUDRAFT_1033663 [Sistotremastrum suecicum HHB10207 ss-3]